MVANDPFLFGNQEITSLIQRRFTPINEKPRPGYGRRVQFSRERDTRPDGVDVRAGGEPIPHQYWLARRSGRANNVRAFDRVESAAGGGYLRGEPLGDVARECPDVIGIRAPDPHPTNPTRGQHG